MSENVADKTFVDIVASARKKKLLNFSYRKRNGQVKQYTVEPYSLKETKGGKALYAFDVNTGKIKCFYLSPENTMDGILYTEVSDVDYQPRNDWKIEII
jgi:predicted DNA-binding transcriptional regulator YafY